MLVRDKRGRLRDKLAPGCKHNELGGVCFPPSYIGAAQVGDVDRETLDRYLVGKLLMSGFASRTKDWQGWGRLR